jgi:DNA-binding transcriptional regulator YhcF (GntR family)
VKYLRQEVNYNKNRPLESIFRNNISRILDFLILNQQFDYSVAEMSKITKVPSHMIQRVLPQLVEKDLVKKTGKVGNTKTYIFNAQSKLAEGLRHYIQTAINVNIDCARRQQISFQVGKKSTS